MPRLSKIGAAALAAFGWTGGASVTASYLVVAGGGGGGAESSSNAGGGGGGAGGYRTGTASLNPTLSYTVTVGAGGNGGPAGQNNGSVGSDSVFDVTTSTGGGYGASRSAGGNGGSGGGGGLGGSGTGGSGNTPSTSPSQGNNGGSGVGTSTGGGGGGASASGSNAPANQTGGNGGAGTANSITGSSVTYAGGGGAGGTTIGTGGAGGGGNGGNNSNGVAGTANLGGGGGGAYDQSSSGRSGGNGGSGVVIISYPAPQQFGGGVVTTSGSNVIHTFNTSGTLSPLSSLTASYLIVAGGGAGGGETGAGGGAGGLLSGSGVTIDPNSTYLVTVGAGGVGVASGVGGNGSNSLFSAFATAAVGGGGGGSVSVTTGNSGGSGGGGGYLIGVAGSGTTGQGNAGGTGGSDGSGTGFSGGGGGGASAVGTSASVAVGGAGGAGTASSISGTSTTYAGGGGGSSGSSPAGAGGSGGGGAGNVRGSGSPTAGTANLGGGGGGSGNVAGAGANGGSGVVIISYAGSTQQMAGGTVTITGGNVIHTFTSSGYLTPIKYVNNSLRFRKSASAYLNRNPASNGTRTTWTYSTWVKRGQLGAGSIIHAQDSGNTVSTEFNFASDDTIYFREYGGSGYTGYLQTTQVFRDPSAWYHLVLVWDSNNGTSGDRIRLYVNGTRITSFSTATYPSSGITTVWNSTNLNRIGFPSTSTMDGYLTKINFVDGQALTPNSFGTFNSYGVWQPITYGGSYGTNGFYLPFTNKTSTTTLGYDFSPNGNNWTTNNISLTAGSTYDSMTDVPTLTSATAANYATLNPVNLGGTSITLSNGNLFATFAGASWFTTSSTMGMVGSGKYYFEFTKTDTSSQMVGIFPPTASISSFVGNDANGYGYFSANGYLYNNGGSSITFGATFTTGDVIGIAFDASTGKLWFSKNNTWQASGSPSTGANPAATASTAYTYMAAVSTNGSGVGTVNFGQQPFIYTPPSGFVALNTYNL